MPLQNENNETADVDLGGIFANVWRWKLPILLAALIATALAFFALQTVDPRYRSKVSILIQNSDDVLTGAGAAQGVPNTSMTDEQGIASQVELIQSEALSRRVIDKLKLARHPEFETSSSPSLMDGMLQMLGVGGSQLRIDSTQAILEAFDKRRSVYQLNRARIVVVEFWAHDPRLAADIANSISTEYIALQEELKRGASPEKLAQLEPELNLQRQKVLQAEEKVADFKASAGLLSGTENGGLAEQDLKELSSELSRVRAEVSQAKAKSDEVQRAVRSGSLASASSVIASPTIQTLLQQQAGLKSELASLGTKLLPKHPKIQSARSQITQIDRQISSEMNKILSSVKSELQVAKARERDLVQRRNVLKSEVAREEEASVELRALQREADAESQLLNAYLIKFKEAQSRQSRDFLPADARIVSSALPASASFFPKKMPILVGTFFGTLLLASMLVLAFSVLSGAQVIATPTARTYPGLANADSGTTEHKVENTAPSTASSVEASAAAPELPASVSPSPPSIAPPMAPEHLPSMPEMPEPSLPSSMMAVAKSLTLLERARVAVVTPDENNKSGGAIGLSRLLASVGPTVLVDMTGAGTASRNMLGQTDLAGLKDVLANDVSFGAAIHPDRVSDAHIIPIGSPRATLTAESAARLPIILDALQQTYRYVLIDLGSSDILGLKRVANASTGFVVATSGADGPQAQSLIASIENAGFAAPVVMFTNADDARAVGIAS